MAFSTAPLRLAVLTLGLLALSTSLAPLAPFPASAQEHVSVDLALYSGMNYRMVGPFRGGRVTTVTGIAEGPGADRVLAALDELGREGRGFVEASCY